MSKNRIERVLSGSLILLGTVSMIIGVADAFGYDLSVVVPKSVAGITLGLLGLLAIAIGIERFFALHDLKSALDNLKQEIGQLGQDVEVLPVELDDRIDALQASLGAAVGGRYLVGKKLINQALSFNAENAKRHIRALIVGDGKRSPKELAETVAQRMKQAKTESESIVFDVVIVVPKGKEPSQDFVDWTRERSAIYVRYEVFEKVQLRILELEPTLTFDVYVVDEDAVLIAFSRLLRSNETSGAIVFEGNEAIAKDFIEWFNEAFDRAVPLDEWQRGYGISSH